jgi:hypothetical protein
VTKLTFHQADKSPRKVGQKIDTVHALGKLGDEGWEVTGVIPASKDYPEDWAMILKRPKS